MLLEYYLKTALILYIRGLLAKCEVKMTGYWPSSFFACLLTETESSARDLNKRSQVFLSDVPPKIVQWGLLSIT